MKFCKYGNPLDALHMGDLEPDMCIECERKILDPLIREAETEKTTLVLWGD